MLQSHIPPSRRAQSSPNCFIQMACHLDTASSRKIVRFFGIKPRPLNFLGVRSRFNLHQILLVIDCVMNMIAHCMCTAPFEWVYPHCATRLNALVAYTFQCFLCPILDTTKPYPIIAAIGTVSAASREYRRLISLHHVFATRRYVHYPNPGTLPCFEVAFHYYFHHLSVALGHTFSDHQIRFINLNGLFSSTTDSRLGVDDRCANNTRLLPPFHYSSLPTSAWIRSLSNSEPTGIDKGTPWLRLLAV